MSEDPFNLGGASSPFEGYDVAQVCENGHTITSALELVPGSSKDFCPQCGSRTISTCQSSGFAIRGSSTEVMVLGYTAPDYCEKCGQPYPWTVKRIDAAADLSELLVELSPEEKETFRRGVAQLTSDTPTTTVAAAKVKALLGKLGGEAYNIAVKVITDVATEAAKKQIGL